KAIKRRVFLPNEKKLFFSQRGLYPLTMKKRSSLLARVCAFLIVACPFVANAQQMPSLTPSTSSQMAQSMDPAAATQAWLATVPADKRTKSDAYFEGGYWLLLWNFLLGVAISLFLLTSRISARIRDFAERRTRFKDLQVTLCAIAYT